MKFWEWWKAEKWEGYGDPDSSVAAWNAALEEAAKIVEARGSEIGGAIQPDKTVAAIRELTVWCKALAT